MLLTLAPATHDPVNAADARIVGGGNANPRSTDRSAHPLPTGQRAVQRDRWWDRVVDCHLQHVGVDRCSGEALGGAADDQLIDSGRAGWRAEGHWPAAVVECG